MSLQYSNPKSTYIFIDLICYVYIMFIHFVLTKMSIHTYFHKIVVINFCSITLRAQFFFSWRVDKSLTKIIYVYIHNTYICKYICIYSFLKLIYSEGKMGQYKFEAQWRYTIFLFLLLPVSACLCIFMIAN